MEPQRYHMEQKGTKMKTSLQRKSGPIEILAVKAVLFWIWI